MNPEVVTVTITLEVAPEAVDLSPASGGTYLTEEAHDAIHEFLGQYAESIEITGEVTS